MRNTLFDTSALPFVTDIKGKCHWWEKVTYNINSFSFYDHFVTNHTEYIILPVYLFERNTINLLQDNGFKFIVRGTNEPLFIAYRSTNCTNTFIEEYKLVVCTLFSTLNTYLDLKCFVDYYLSQDVDKLFLFFNGKITDINNFPKYSQVEYLEWNFTYWQSFEHTRQLNHHAQPSLYNAFVRKISPFCDWTCFIDLDEFIKTPNNSTLKAYLNNFFPLKDKDMSKNLLLEHRFAQLNNETNIIFYEKECSFPSKSKCIVNKLQAETSRVHVHRTAPFINSNLLLLHTKHNNDAEKNECCTFINSQ